MGVSLHLRESAEEYAVHVQLPERGDVAGHGGGGVTGVEDAALAEEERDISRGGEAGCPGGQFRETARVVADSPTRLAYDIEVRVAVDDRCRYSYENRLRGVPIVDRDA